MSEMHHLLFVMAIAGNEKVRKESIYSQFYQGGYQGSVSGTSLLYEPFLSFVIYFYGPACTKHKVYYGIRLIIPS